MAYRLGIDIGGTFTDLVLVNDEDHKIYFGKTLTTYPDPTLGIISGVDEILNTHDKNICEVKGIVHGTTLVTNAVIERKGAVTGLVTTKNFEDVLEIGREMRYDIYDIFITMPKPLVPGDLRVGVTERVNHIGQIIQKMDENDLIEQVNKLTNKGIKSLAISFLHSYINPEHEKKAEQIIQKYFPDLYISVSSDIMPEIREYERTSASVMNAYVQPLATDYLKNLESRLKYLGFQGQLHIMDSAGRLTSVDGAAKYPVQLLESGPAGGTMAGVYFGELTQKRDILTFDMGGTTAKASVIKNLEPTITHHFEAAREKRFKKGSGLPVRIPVVDMIEIGAGGGSIAHLNHLGLLTVGPESASSVPGPACYDREGRLPTVTDADLVLGYLNPVYFLGGTMRLNVERAKDSIEEFIAKPLNISIEEAAWGIHRVVNENMANAARVHVIEKGLDPRHFSMMAFGGAGPVHSFHTSRLLYSPELIIPSGAGVLSALGFLVSPIAKEEICSYVSVLSDINWKVLNEKIKLITDKAVTFVKDCATDQDKISTTLSCEMRYIGQGHEIAVKIPFTFLNKESEPQLKQLFESAYEKQYGRIINNMKIEAITWRVLAHGPKAKLKIEQSVIGDSQILHKGNRKVFWGKQYEDTPVYNRYALKTGDILEGPCIIEEFESTTVVGHAASVTTDEYKNIIIQNHYL